MWKAIFVLPSVLLLAIVAQEPAAPSNPLPADAATLKNPVTPTPESQARAKVIYGMDCVLCHGAHGNGKGELVADMQLHMRDFNDPATLRDKSDGELFYAIKNGVEKDRMPAEGPRAKDDEVWNLVLLLRSFAQK